MKLSLCILFIFIFTACVKGKVAKSAPSISSVNPIKGVAVGGTTITLSGSNLTSINRVTIASVNCSSVLVLNDSTMTCVTPAGTSNNADIHVYSSDGTSGSLLAAYQYIPEPIISSISPSQGAVAGGNTITLTGSGF